MPLPDLLKTDLVLTKLRFAKPVRDVRDERTGRVLGDGTEFPIEWKQNEAVVLSFDSR